MRYVLILLGLLWVGTAQAIDCQTPPDCTSLGYAAENDPNCAANGYVYCPFDESYKRCVIKDCSKLGFTESDKTSWCGKIVKCKGNEKFTACKALCEVGDVYYADGTCGYAEDYDGTKTPVGVVFYVSDEGRHGKVVSLNELTFDENDNFYPEEPFGQSKREPYFGLCYTDPEINAYTYEELIAALQSYNPDAFAGKENTDILINTKPTNENCSNGTYQKGSLTYNKFCQATMALAAHDFYPPKVERTNPFTGQGKWYMPSVGELVLLWNPDMSKLELVDKGINPNVEGVIRDRVNENLQFLRSKEVMVDLLSGEGNNYLWSSSRMYGRTYYAVHIFRDGKISVDGACGYKPMRAVLAF